MERLTGTDAAFIYMETPSVHMHTIKAAVLDPAPGVAYTVDAVKQGMEARLHRLPPFRRRLVAVPFGFHHPVWIEDPALDLDRHVVARRAALPGDAAALDAVVSEIASTPLERDRPLWEISVVDGLAGGRVAVVAKVHHALADGVAAAELLANAMPAAGDEVAAGAPSWAPEPIPTRRELLLGALRDHVPALARLPELAIRTAKGLARAARRRRELAAAPPMPLRDAPMLSLNGALTARRAFATTSLPLDEIREVRRAVGVTLNDLLLTLVAGALRSYLAARGELPARPLVAEVPVSIDRPDGPRRLGGNRVSNLFTALRTDIADPLERARAIHDVTQSAKELNQVLGPEMYWDWSSYAPPLPMSALNRLYSRLRLADRHRPAVNVIVSCVPGPRETLEWSGGRLAQIFSVGPIIEGAALNVTAWSYVDRLYVGVLSCPDRVRSPEEIAIGIDASLREMQRALRRAPHGAGPAADAAPRDPAGTPVLP